MPSVENNDKSGIKMEDKKFHLTWETYNDHLRNMLHNMMVSSELTDVTLVCEDKTQFKAHKFVLKECSTVFKSIINTNQQNQSIFLRGIFAEEMESILQFIYLGSITLYQARMDEFFNVAKSLEIKEISNAAHEDQQSDKLTTKIESDDVGDDDDVKEEILLDDTRKTLELFQADNEEDGENHFPHPWKCSRTRRCKACLRGVQGEGYIVARNRMPSQAQQCQHCKEAVCKSHQVLLC